MGNGTRTGLAETQAHGAGLQPKRLEIAKSLSEMVAPKTEQHEKQQQRHHQKSLAAAPLSLSSALGLGSSSAGLVPGADAAAGAPAPIPEVLQASLPLPEMPKAAAAPQAMASLVAQQGSVREQGHETDAFTFSFTIRVAEGTGLGLHTSMPVAEGGGPASYLLVESATTGGAVEAWNRQCSSSGAPQKVVLPGDRITRVNRAEGAEAMLHVLNSCRLLKFNVARMSGEEPALVGATCSENAAPQPSAPLSEQLVMAERSDLPLKVQPMGLHVGKTSMASAIVEQACAAPVRRAAPWKQAEAADVAANAQPLPPSLRVAPWRRADGSMPDWHAHVPMRPAAVTV